MPIIMLSTKIHAPIEVCFDLARSIEMHLQSTEATRERAVGGVTHGLLGLNQEVTWEATHFGIRQRLTSRITAFDRPNYFRDSQVCGPFRRFDHDHTFTIEAGAVIMRDVFDYESPLGLLGRCADWFFLRGYMARFLRKRAEAIRRVAESTMDAPASNVS
jgi:ligand-binding SRPBCC domain-containing protein